MLDASQNFGTAAVRRDITGGVIGLDRAIGSTLVGAAFGFDRTSLGVAARSTTGDLRGYHFAGYAVSDLGRAYAAATLAADFFSDTIDRQVDVSGTGGHLRGKFHGRGFSGRAEAGYRLGGRILQATPFAAFQIGRIRNPAYAEIPMNGAAPFQLGYAAQVAKSARVDLGVRLSADFGQDFHKRIYLRTDWLHELERTRSLTARFKAFQSDTFDVAGAPIDQDTLRISAGSDLAVTTRLSLGLAWRGEFGSHIHANFGMANVTWAW
jgi:outer membrane autotransporter protein